MVSTTTLLVLSSLTLFLVGILGGWLLTRASVNTSEVQLKIAVGTVVTIVWVVSIAAEILIVNYTASVVIHGIMGAVVGYLFSDQGVNINLGGK